jgi:hypothetical protein
MYTGSRLALYRELSCDESVIPNAHGGDLVSALAKLASPEEPFLLQATASSLISHRLARLAGLGRVVCLAGARIHQETRLYPFLLPPVFCAFARMKA